MSNEAHALPRSTIHGQVLSYASRSHSNVTIQLQVSATVIARVLLSDRTRNLDHVSSSAPIAAWLARGHLVQIEYASDFDCGDGIEALAFANLTPPALRRRGISVAAACASLGVASALDR